MKALQLMQSRIALPLWVSLLFPLLGVSTYWTNDDLGNMLVLAGAESGQPDFRSPVIGPFLGLFISNLYRVAEDIPWYPIFILMVPTFLLSLALYDLRNRVRPELQWALAITGSSFLALLALRVNYTFSAFLSSGLALLVLQIRVSKKDLMWRELVLPITMCVVALSIRAGSTSSGVPISQAFVICAALSVIMFLPYLRKFTQRQLLRYVVSIGAVFLVATCIGFWSVQTSGQWREFLAFYNLRGQLNGVEKVNRYLSENSPAQIFSDTGLNRFSIEELGNFELFDAVNVTNRNLESLISAAERYSAGARSFKDVVRSVLSEGTKFFFVSGLLVSLLLLFSAVARGAVKFLGIKSLAGPALGGFVLAILAGYTSADIRLPEPVAAGLISVWGIQLISVFGLCSDQQQSDAKFSKRSKLFFTAALSAIGIFSLWHFRVYEIDRGWALKSESQIWRTQYKESQDLNEVFLAGALLPGFAFQAFPFDMEVVGEYRDSRIVTGGSTVRSPQWLARWNRITGGADRFDETFNPSFYLRVATDLSNASRLSSGLSASGRFDSDDGVFCAEPESLETTDLFKIQTLPCKEIVMNGFENYDSEDLLWSAPRGFEILVSHNDSKSLRFELHSPFGEFAKHHKVLIEHANRLGELVWNGEVVIRPGAGSKISLERLERGDSVRIRSISRCVVPYELDPLLFLDRRVLCVGISDLAFGNEIVSLAKLIDD
jgi:hypothetical protein